MILVDFSSILHRMIFRSVKDAKPRKINGEYITDDFIKLTLSYIFEELIDIEQTHKARFGKMILMLDGDETFSLIIKIIVGKQEMKVK